MCGKVNLELQQEKDFIPLEYTLFLRRENEEEGGAPPSHSAMEDKRLRCKRGRLRYRGGGEVPFFKDRLYSLCCNHKIMILSLMILSKIRSQREGGLWPPEATKNCIRWSLHFSVVLCVLCIFFYFVLSSVVY